MRHFHDFELKGQRVVKRVDINSPIDERGEIMSNPRLERHGESIRRLSDVGAKVIVIAHQGRAGKSDFVSLFDHARLLERITQRQVQFLPTTDPEKVRHGIEQMENGDILLLENVRMWEGEDGEHDKSLLVKTIAPIADIYILDALSVSHRDQASVVGFTGHLPSAAGPVLGDEIKALDTLGSGNLTLILGGGKAKDSIKIMRKWLEEKKARKVLLGGAISILFLDAAGHNIADSHAYLEANQLLEHKEEAKELLEKHKEFIVLPDDVALDIGGERIEARVNAIERGEIKDIGENTMQHYHEEIIGAKHIVVNGPMGVYEKEEFGLGTKKVLDSIAESEAFSLVGGGHTITAIKTFEIPESKFSYVSLSGKALVQYLSGVDLPAIKALKANRKSFPI